MLRMVCFLLFIFVASPLYANDEKLNLNQASVQELSKLPGMSVYKARALVAYRRKNGDFTDIEELREVKGFKRMTAKTLKALAEQVEML